MDTTTFKHIDKIIETSDIPKVALGLILGIDIEDGRLPGIVTSHDLIKIKSYINKALSLPYKIDDVIKFIHYNEINVPQLSPDNILSLFIQIREHAFDWNKIEYAIKQQAIDLEIIGREITSTGENIIAFIKQMPLLAKISSIINDFSEQELENIQYKSQDKEVATQLIHILESMKEDIENECKKTIKIKDSLSTFRSKIIGGKDSKNIAHSSIYHDILNKKRYINEFYTDNNNSLIEERDLLIEEISRLKDEYKHYVGLAFTGLAIGIIGVIITGGIFGAKAEVIRKKKNELIEQVKKINIEIDVYAGLSLHLNTLYIELSEIEQFIEDTNMALEHIEYVWQAILTEIEASITNFNKINNALELIKFSIYLEKIITPWYMVIGYSKEILISFDNALSTFYSSNS
ncbi:alpha-xenorhabdolysin family binary toxin subunit A [Proteus terrae]|uniref:alpha-xenorhabdolysin family binary toxin subunit A n=1 Tax=Proteus terrae TaxID=1574161 RepID=UPI00132FAF59|nr:alpha-xenorhabdolysin family binary toxin subunit A [Proteus terrae]QKD68951.1 alpha-xenorhabdolysin family binary toxin subunit A [Proteus terrae subsp. cibarius]QKD74125.1 alpha-xenorhabdolysin family binary toxin subunit A [Proteus terrae subsp. cibarius]UDF24761.1 alpha-xenorhabdolysin family binary toxin subunit A [Proteus terrae subsp. cibarius]WCG85539.1 alpha-xenorhabdolysin family binary toxin subunit A [Proteus terrae]